MVQFQRRYKMTMEQAYSELGISAPVSDKVLKQQYLKLAKLRHPDVKATGSKHKFQRLQDAYDIAK